MKNNKTLCVIIALTLLVAVLVPVTALAASPNYPFSFDFYNLSNDKTDAYEKGDSEQNWYISLYNNGSNNMSSSNVLGVRMNRGGYYVSGYHTFSNYVTGYRLPYTTSVNSTDMMYMGAKKDNTSTSSAALHISGQFNP